jgi:regulatory protein YycI of two-component signal transduction system YycFG
MITKIIFFIAFVLVAVFVVSLLKKSKNEILKESIYKKRESIMDPSESAFFFELQKQLPNGYHIFPKMRIADIIETKSGKGYYRKRDKILPKHVDFLVCDSYFKPIVAIELNGSYHNNPNQQEKDFIKKEIFEDAKLPLETINVGVEFNQAIKKIADLLLHN